MQPLPGPQLGFPTGPEDLLVDADGHAAAHRQGLQLGCAVLRARADAHGDRQRGAGDPYPIDMLFMYMANMSWNSSMNTGATLEHLTDKDPATGEYKIPQDHLLRRLFLRDGAPTPT